MWKSIRVPNRGYGAAANEGFRRAFALGASAIALLNDDIVVRAGWSEPLQSALAQPKVGAAQPKLLIAGSNPPRINSLGVTIGRDGAGTDIGDGTLDVVVGAPSEIARFTGGAVMFAPEFLRETGGFDERFFLYYEDVDLAARGCRPRLDLSAGAHLSGRPRTERDDCHRRRPHALLPGTQPAVARLPPLRRSDAGPGDLALGEATQASTPSRARQSAGGGCWPAHQAHGSGGRGARELNRPAPLERLYRGPACPSSPGAAGSRFHSRTARQRLRIVAVGDRARLVVGEHAGRLLPTRRPHAEALASSATKICAFSSP